MIPGDEGLMRWVNGWPEALAPFFIFWSTGLKSPWVIGILLAFLAWLFARKERRMGAAITLVGWLGANEVCDWLKAGLPSPRPCSVADWVQVRGVGCADSMGTASSHSANMMFVAVSLLFLDRRIGAPWVAVALFTGVSRSYVGVHWPSQVILGWLVGAAVAGLLWTLARALVKRRGQAEPPHKP